jgi:exopolysaccharide production protein ExoQ
MAFIAYLPEIASFLIFLMISTQLPAVGPFLILGELALMGLLFLVRPRAFVEVITRWWPLLLTPLIATISTIWSEQPMTSLRYGAQFLFTMFMGVLIARLLSPRRFLIVFACSLFVFCILCILNGRQGTSAEGMVLIGLTGSKNQLGYAAQLLMMSALTMLLMGVRFVLLRWIALLSFPLALYLVLEVNSATALLMAVGGSAALIGLWFVQRFTPGGRLSTILAALVILAPISLVIPEIIQAMNHFLFDTLDKDPTLTGRVFLWAAADDLSERRPLLGYGYQAIWIGDSTESIGLRRMAGITDGRTFHFHDQFRQIRVDTGWVGLIAFIGLLTAMGLALIRRILLKPDPAVAFFFVIFLLMVLRAFTDIIIGPFSIHTLIFAAIAVYAFSPAQDARFATAEAPRPAPARRPARRFSGRP